MRNSYVTKMYGTGYVVEVINGVPVRRPKTAKENELDRKLLERSLMQCKEVKNG